VTAVTCTDHGHRHAPIVVRLRELRYAAVAMLALAAAWPLLPTGAGLPCPWRTLTGIPCPFCGMTRSVTSTVHLDVAAAFDLNPAGIAVVVAALVLLVAWRVRRVHVPLWVIPAAVVTLWAYQIAFYPHGA
jgi:hypothetical protein